MKTVTLTEEQWQVLVGHMRTDIEEHLAEGDMDEDVVMYYENLVLNVEEQLK